jgi:hypothetical protein
MTITYGAIKSGEAAVPVAAATEVRDLDINLPKIRPDQSAQPRENLHNDRIAEYAESMKAGDQFPPLTVFHDGEVYWLADGFHRFYAAQHAGRKHIRCYVRQGGLRDAILYSVGANAKHGLARSDADKERAVLRLLNDAEWSTWTDRDIAKRCFVSHPFVAKVRKAHAGVTGNVSSERTYTTKHGTTATMKTAGINASRATNFRAENVQVDAADHQKENAVEFVAAQGFDPADRPVAASAEFAQPRNIFDELVSLWKEADAGVRQDFKAYIKGSEAVAKVSIDTFQAKASEDNGATGKATMRRADSMAGEASRSSVGDDTDEADRDAGNTPTCALTPRDVFAVGTNSQSAASTAEAVTDKPQAPRPSVTANNSSPANSAVADGQLGIPSSDALAAGQGESLRISAKSEQAVSQFNNPRCQKPETCHLAHSRNECFDCNIAWSKRPKDEQVRLWAEAIQASRAAA